MLLRSLLIFSLSHSRQHKILHWIIYGDYLWLFLGYICGCGIISFIFLLLHHHHQASILCACNLQTFVFFSFSPIWRTLEICSCKRNITHEILNKKKLIKNGRGHSMSATCSLSHTYVFIILVQLLLCTMKRHQCHRLVVTSRKLGKYNFPLCYDNWINFAISGAERESSILYYTP